LIYGSLKIENQTNISNEVLLVQGFESTLTIIDTTIENIVTGSSFINLAATDFAATSITANNIVVADGGQPFIIASFDSSMTVSNMTFANSTSSFIRVLSSTLSLNDVTISNISTSVPVANLLSATDVDISDTSIDLISGSLTTIINIGNSIVTSIDNLTISNAAIIGINIQDTQISSIQNLKIQNMTQCMIAERSSITEFESSNFTN
jgi:hypothetical protein